MLIPKSPRRQKLREKKCLYPECNAVFYGPSHAKFCHEHRKPEHRIRKQVPVEPVDKTNLVLKHQYSRATDVVLTCALEGCGAPFTITVYPRQHVYPKYCPDHRNEFRRNQQLKVLRKNHHDSHTTA